MSGRWWTDREGSVWGAVQHYRQSATGKAQLWHLPAGRYRLALVGEVPDVRPLADLGGLVLLQAGDHDSGRLLVFEDGEIKDRHPLLTRLARVETVRAAVLAGDTLWVRGTLKGTMKANRLFAIDPAGTIRHYKMPGRDLVMGLHVFDGRLCINDGRSIYLVEP